MSSTLNQNNASSLVVPSNGSWKTINSVTVPGSLSEPVGLKMYVNLSGTLKPGMDFGIVDIRACRNAVTDEKSPDFNETSLMTYTIAGWTKNASGAWTFKHYISHTWWLTRNFSKTAWQIRARAHIASATAKTGYYTGATDFE